jgi:penicillin-binding protein activator
MNRSVLVATALCAAWALSPAEAQRARPAEDIDPASRMANFGTGIGIGDITKMADILVRDMFQRPDIMNAPKPPRIILDGAHIYNKSSQRIDTDVISDQLRAQLIRAAQGRLRFLSRENIQLIEEERELKRQGQTDVGTRGLTRAVAGADYRLVGRLTSIDGRDTRTGAQQRAMQLVFELVDLESTETVYISEPYVTVRQETTNVMNR